MPFSVETIAGRIALSAASGVPALYISSDGAVTPAVGTGVLAAASNQIVQKQAAVEYIQQNSLVYGSAFNSNVYSSQPISVGIKRFFVVFKDIKPVSTASNGKGLELGLCSRDAGGISYISGIYGNLVTATSGGLKSERTIVGNTTVVSGTSVNTTTPISGIAEFEIVSFTTSSVYYTLKITAGSSQTNTVVSRGYMYSTLSNPYTPIINSVYPYFRLTDGGYLSGDAVVVVE